MEEENEQNEKGMSPEPQDDDLLAEDDDEAEQAPESDSRQDDLMAMMLEMNTNMNTILHRLSRVEDQRQRDVV